MCIASGSPLYTTASQAIEKIKASSEGTTVPSTIPDEEDDSLNEYLLNDTNGYLPGISFFLSDNVGISIGKTLIL